MTVFELIDACCEARDNLSFMPSGGTTHCNEAVQYIASKMGCSVFTGMLANAMVDLMDKDQRFQAIPMAQAQDLANQGKLVIAGAKEDVHGHVCVIRPGTMGYSANWKMNTPKVVNIGKHNFIDVGVNWSFRDVPRFWVWNPDEP